MNLQMETTEEKQVGHITTPRLDVLMECQGLLKIHVSEDQSNWTPLIEKKVNQADGLWSLNSTDSLQSSEQSQLVAPPSSKQRAPRRRASPARKRGK